MTLNHPLNEMFENLDFLNFNIDKKLKVSLKNIDIAKVHIEENDNTLKGISTPRGCILNHKPSNPILKHKNLSKEKKHLISKLQELI